MYRRIVRRVPISVKAGVGWSRHYERWSMVFREGGRGQAENLRTYERLAFRWDAGKTMGGSFWFRRQARLLFHAEVAPHLSDPLMLAPESEFWCSNGSWEDFTGMLSTVASAHPEVWADTEWLRVWVKCQPDTRASHIEIYALGGSIADRARRKLMRAIEALLLEIDVRGRHWVCVKGSGTRRSHYEGRGTTWMTSLSRPTMHETLAARERLRIAHLGRDATPLDSDPLAVGLFRQRHL